MTKNPIIQILNIKIYTIFPAVQALLNHPKALVIYLSTATVAQNILCQLLKKSILQNILCTFLKSPAQNHKVNMTLTLVDKRTAYDLCPQNWSFDLHLSHHIKLKKKKIRQGKDTFVIMGLVTFLCLPARFFLWASSMQIDCKQMQLFFMPGIFQLPSSIFRLLPPL